MNESSRIAHEARASAFDRWWKICTHNGVLPTQREALAREAYFAAWGGSTPFLLEPAEELRAHKIMTEEEYDALNLKGWHMVCKNYDGVMLGGVGIRYLSDPQHAMPLQDRVTVERDRPDDLRAAGWSVAVHNDYRLHGRPMTFWLLTHPDGRWLKGEGPDDITALEQIRRALERAPMVAEERGEAKS